MARRASFVATVPAVIEPVELDLTALSLEAARDAVAVLSGGIEAVKRGNADKGNASALLLAEFTSGACWEHVIDFEVMNRKGDQVTEYVKRSIGSVIAATPAQSQEWKGAAKRAIVKALGAEFTESLWTVLNRVSGMALELRLMRFDVASDTKGKLTVTGGGDDELSAKLRDAVTVAAVKKLLDGHSGKATGGGKSKRDRQGEGEGEGEGEGAALVPAKPADILRHALAYLNAVKACDVAMREDEAALVAGIARAATQIMVMEAESI
jgi:hypothetical protein